jgi:uncharacterized protein (DUF488 family)
MRGFGVTPIPENPSTPSAAMTPLKKTNPKNAIESPVFTIGYEQATASAFFEALADAKVGLIVDVRAVAASRRPGFSKRQLAAGLDQHGIGYVHLQKLGTPKEGRLAARSGHAGEMLRIYERHLKTAEAQRELDELEALARESLTTGPAAKSSAAKSSPGKLSSRAKPSSPAKPGRPICLLCYERDPAQCHRQRLAAELHARLGLPVEHLFCAPV